MKVTIVIPMYNESKIIANTARELSEYMEQNFDDYEIIFSDDGSLDGCADIVDSLKLSSVRTIRNGTNRGKGYAVRQGMMAAEGDICLFTDADLAYGTNVIGESFKLIQEDKDTDILLGSRNIGKDGYEGYTLMRRVMSKAYIKVLCIVGGFKMSDSQCGFKVFRKDAAKALFSECTVDGFAFDFEVILRALNQHRKITEMSVKIINHRTSSIRPLKDATRMLKDLMRIKKQIKRKAKKIKYNSQFKRFQ